LEIRAQQTPNPNAMKFTLDRIVVEGKASKSFFSAAQAQADPLASALFSVDGVASLFMVADFITVTKTPAANWPELVPRVESVIRETLG
jgi:hypothetical protein